MPVRLPDLYKRSYEEISDEMLASIPKYTSKWTNHNPSDPGITILELLSWIAETTLYRINRVPEESYINFLRFVTGASSTNEIDRLLREKDLDLSHKKILEFLKEIEDGNKKTMPEIKAASLNFLKSRYRAVTEEDFRELAIEATVLNTGEKARVKRAIIDKSVQEEKVVVIVVSDMRDKYDELIEQVKNYLTPRKLIGTIIEVNQPVYTGVEINIKFVRQSHARIERKIDDRVVDEVKENIIKRVGDYLDPFKGGPEKKGWPYKRPLTKYEIVQIVEETNGVERAASVVFDDDDELMIKEIGGLVDPSIKVEENI